MHQGKLVFAQLMAHLPLSTFRRYVAAYRGDFKVKDFSCLDQFLAMAFAQLTWHESLCDIEINFAKKRLRLPHSLYEILQILSLTMFETINCLQRPTRIQSRISSLNSSFSYENVGALLIADGNKLTMRLIQGSGRNNFFQQGQKNHLTFSARYFRDYQRPTRY